MCSILQTVSLQYKVITCEISLQKAHLFCTVYLYINAYTFTSRKCKQKSREFSAFTGIFHNLWSSQWNFSPQPLSTLKTEVMGARKSFKDMQTVSIC